MKKGIHSLEFALVLITIGLPALLGTLDILTYIRGSFIVSEAVKNIQQILTFHRNDNLRQLENATIRFLERLALLRKCNPTTRGCFRVTSRPAQNNAPIAGEIIIEANFKTMLLPNYYIRKVVPVFRGGSSNETFSVRFNFS
ncbi:MAG: hypothetical protein NZO16_00845 [Deltaproteobacteria bacterium]|nr:hypothetical protein [Deltaproteobacteria bacterium]